jgi:TRAP-type C4-dicarboxylate transport system permease small subunit
LERLYERARDLNNRSLIYDMIAGSSTAGLLVTSNQFPASIARYTQWIMLAALAYFFGGMIFGSLMIKLDDARRTTPPKDASPGSSPQ